MMLGSLSLGKDHKALIFEFNTAMAEALGFFTSPF